MTSSERAAGLEDRRPPAQPQTWGQAWGWAGAGFAGLVLVIVVLFHRVIGSMITTWLNTVTYNHGFLVLPISLWLVWRLRRRLAALTPVPAPWALAILAGAGLLWLVGEAAEANLLRQLALVTMILGAALLTFGLEVCWRLAFPLLFLFFMVPFGDDFIPQLQNVTATLAVAVIRIVGIPVFRDGILIETPTGRFEVAEACAGIRFLIANIVVVVLFSYLAYRHWWKRALMLGLGLAVPVVANGLRAAGIILIAYWSDNQLATGVDHIVYGWGFFAAIMLLLLLIGESFADRHQPEPPAALVARPPLAGDGRRRFIAAIAVALPVLAAPPLYAALAFRPPAQLTPYQPPVLPAVAGWQTEPATGWQPRFEGADQTLLQGYRGPAGSVDLFVAWYAWQRPGAEAVYHANRLADGERWLRVGLGTARLAASGLPTAGVERLATVAGGRHRVVVRWYRVAGRFTGDPLTAKLLQVLARLAGGSQAATVLALATEVTETPEAALRQLDRFLADAGDLPGWLAGWADGR